MSLSPSTSRLTQGPTRSRGMRGVLILCLALCLLPAAQAGADGSTMAPPSWLELEDHGDITLDFSWSRDTGLQRKLQDAVADLGLQSMIDEQRLAIALVNLDDLETPRLAELNGTTMMYAASLPKLAVLYAAFEAEKEGRLTVDAGFRKTLTDMIRVSSNAAASKVIQRLGFNYIASVMWQSGLYDPDLGGGLWIGKAYGGKNDRWRRDPIANTSHGATALAAARLLAAIEEGKAVDEEGSKEMKEILGNPGINHKFVKGLRTCRPGSHIFRKSGTWCCWHGDAAIVERKGKRYVAAALCEDEKGSSILERLIVALDDCIPDTGRPSIARHGADSGLR